jgi:hypothetical protein
MQGNTIIQRSNTNTIYSTDRSDAQNTRLTWALIALDDHFITKERRMPPFGNFWGGGSDECAMILDTGSEHLLP